VRRTESRAGIPTASAFKESTSCIVSLPIQRVGSQEKDDGDDVLWFEVLSVVLVIRTRKRLC